MDCCEVSVPVPWGVIKGIWWGSRSKRPTLCLHGWQDNGGTFDNLIPLLPSEFSYLCIDLPGHGFSSHIPKGQPYYLWWDGVYIIRRIVKHFKWDAVSLIGHSLGAGVSFLYAATFPKETEFVIALDSVAPIWKQTPGEVGTLIDRFLYYEENATSKDIVGSYDRLFEVTLAGHDNSLTKESCKVMMKRGVVSDGNGQYKFTRDNRLKVGWVGKPTFESVMEYAKQIECCYCNIKAVPGRTMDHIDVYKEVLAEIEQNCKYFKYVEIPGTHHFHLNKAEDLAPVISEFIFTSLKMTALGDVSVIV